jgi:cation:H+ antiporter
MSGSILSILMGLSLLVIGAQFLVRGASRLAMSLGISSLVVGLTVVAFGTSAPELAVSVKSCLSGNTNIVLGNVIGSNVYNVLFILGLCAVIMPLSVAPQLIRLDVPIMIGVSLALLAMALDGTIGRVDGLVLLAAIVAYTVFVVRQSRKEAPAVKEEYDRELKAVEKPDNRRWLHIIYIIAGLALLTFGSNWLVEGAVAIATKLGVSDLVIGMTVVTMGTTAPEVSACLVASFRGEGDIAVGNIVGSNIFNILAVLGTGATMAPNGIQVDPAMLSFGLPVMVAVAVACLPVFFAGHQIRRWEGMLLLVYFALYTAHLVMEARRDAWLQTFDWHVIWFVVPLTVVALVVSVSRELKHHSARKS